MKRLTEILKSSKITSHKAASYYNTFLAGISTFGAYDSSKEGNYKNSIFYGITAVIIGLMAYHSNKMSMKKLK